MVTAKIEGGRGGMGNMCQGTCRVHVIDVKRRTTGEGLTVQNGWSDGDATTAKCSMPGSMGIERAQMG